MDGFSGTHLKLVAYPFQQHRRLLPQPQHRGHLDPVALAPQFHV
jgi:hypothetical protein